MTRGNSCRLVINRFLSDNRGINNIEEPIATTDSGQIHDIDVDDYRVHNTEVL